MYPYVPMVLIHSKQLWTVCLFVLLIGLLVCDACQHGHIWTLVVYNPLSIRSIHRLNFIRRSLLVGHCAGQGGQTVFLPSHRRVCSVPFAVGKLQIWMSCWLTRSNMCSDQGFKLSSVRCPGFFAMDQSKLSSRSGVEQPAKKRQLGKTSNK